MKKRQNNLQQENYRQLLKDYLYHITVLGYSKNGCDIKYGNVLEFFTWLEQQEINSIEEITPAQIKAHYEYLKTRPHHKQEGVLTLSTIQQHMQAIRQLFALMQDKGQLLINPISTLNFIAPKQKSKQRKIADIPQIKEMYRVTETLQERAILSLAYGCGLRSMELAAINKDDVLFNDNILIVQNGKGNKRRVIPMTAYVQQDIKNYFENERPLYVRKEQEPALILNIKGHRMRKYTYRKIIQQICERTGNIELQQKEIRIHHLRHSIATHLLEQGVPIEQVRDFLGHTHLETTEIYTRVSQKQLKQLIE